jgi:uncharacterized protein YutE (UPF0331/DUF86 family)
MVDVDKARRLLAVLLDAIADLRRYRTKLTLAQLTSSRDDQHMVLHALYLAVQATVDLALHIAADHGLPQSPTYRTAFRPLADHGIIDLALAERLEGWAGFRNVLAHFYSVVDYARVFAALSEVGDLEEFATSVGTLLTSDEGSP